MTRRGGARISAAGFRFTERPLWSYLRVLSARIEDPQGRGVVEVERGAGDLVRDLLTRPEDDEPLRGPLRYELHESDDERWPALIVRTRALDASVVARASTIELGRRLQRAFEADASAEAERARTARYWFRTPL